MEEESLEESGFHGKLGANKDEIMKMSVILIHLCEKWYVHLGVQPLLIQSIGNIMFEPWCSAAAAAPITFVFRSSIAWWSEGRLACSHRT